MKIKTEKAPQSFEPVTMTITFESREELKALWNRMNLNSNSFKSVYLDGDNQYDFDDNVDNSVKSAIWRKCNTLLK